MNAKPINGFSRKLHLYQILSYVFFAVLIFSYFFLTFCLSRTVLKIVGGCLEGFFGILIFVSGWVTTAIDPSDTYLIALKKAKDSNVPYDAPEQEFFCNVDFAYVHESSKHCKRCNRCTEDFDHHCKWVNNDIGRKNYKPFVALIVSVLIFLLVYLAFAIVVTVDWANNHSLPDNSVFLYNTDGQIRGAMIALWIVLAISLIFLLLDFNLVLFHFYLIKKGLTTFQYIVVTEERKEQKRELERARRILGEEKPKRTCLDFVLCLKKKKKKPTIAITTQENPPLEHHPSLNCGGDVQDEDQAAIKHVGIEMVENERSKTGPVSKNVIGGDTEREEEQARTAEQKEEISAKNKRESIQEKYIDKSGNALVIEDIVEEVKGVDEVVRKSNERVPRINKLQNKELDVVEEQKKESLNVSKGQGNNFDEVKMIGFVRDKEINDKKKQSPSFASMDEFGEETKRHYFKNKDVVGQVLQFEGWKEEEKNFNDSRPVSLHIVDDNCASGSKEKEVKSIHNPREQNSSFSTTIGKESKDIINLKKQPFKQYNSSHESKDVSNDKHENPKQ